MGMGRGWGGDGESGYRPGGGGDYISGRYGGMYRLWNLVPVSGSYPVTWEGLWRCGGSCWQSTPCHKSRAERVRTIGRAP